jgi:hypothetical protein
MGMAEDNREFTRVHLRATASFELPDGTTVVGEVADLCMNGLFINTATPMDKGTVGALTLLFASGDDVGLALHGQGTVTRTTDRGVGLRIKEISLDSYHHLTNLVLYNSTDVVRSQGEIDHHVGIKKHTG